MSGMRFEFFDIDNLTDEQYEQTLALMPPDRRKKVTAITNDHTRKSTVAADFLARAMVSARLGIDPASVVIDRLESGQPVAVGLPCRISLSHSGGIAMCAVSDRPVGADIEIISDKGQRVMERVCSDPEKAFILACGSFDARRFFQVWTAKEAALKRRGQGLSGGISTALTADENGMFPTIEGGQLLTGEYCGAVYAIVY